jgi:hypothetical protein
MRLHAVVLPQRAQQPGARCGDYTASGNTEKENGNCDEPSNTCTVGRRPWSCCGANSTSDLQNPKSLNKMSGFTSSSSRHHLRASCQEQCIPPHNITPSGRRRCTATWDKHAVRIEMQDRNPSIVATGPCATDAVVILAVDSS